MLVPVADVAEAGMSPGFAIVTWCVHLVVSFAIIRGVIWMRDGDPLGDPWAMAGWTAAMAATVSTLMDLL